MKQTLEFGFKKKISNKVMANILHYIFEKRKEVYDYQQRRCLGKEELKNERRINIRTFKSEIYSANGIKNNLYEFIILFTIGKIFKALSKDLTCSLGIFLTCSSTQNVQF